LTSYPFHQSTDLLYLTGFNEPNACAILSNDEFLLFVQPQDPFTETWDGRRIGLEGAIQQYGATRSYPIDQIHGAIKNLLNQNTTIYTDLPIANEPQMNYLLGTHINTKSTSATHVDHHVVHRSSLFQKCTLKPLGVLLEQFRMFKSRNEMQLMRQSGRIAGRAFVKAMQQTKPGLSEHQVHAILEFEGKMQGATGLAYVPVVAGGLNSLILHYVQNQDLLRDGDLVLVDAGVEYGFYASDITRTWPVNGTFSDPQRALYQAVLTCQKQLIQVLSIYIGM
jgi:intermediate cleaving peptidase 55